MKDKGEKIVQKHFLFLLGCLRAKPVAHVVRPYLELNPRLA